MFLLFYIFSLVVLFLAVRVYRSIYFLCLFGFAGFDLNFCALADDDSGFSFLYWAFVYDPFPGHYFEPA